MIAEKSFTFSGHSAPLYALDVFTDNSFFSGGGDRIVSVRDLNEDSTAIAIVNTGSTIYSLKYLPEKKILLAGVSGGGMHVVDLNEKKEIRFLVAHQKGIFDIKYSKKYDKIITAGGDGMISIWSGNDYSFLGSHRLCSEKVRSISIDRNGERAAIGCGDGTISIIDINRFVETERFDAHQLSVNVVCYHPTLNMLISGGKDAHLNYWDADDVHLIKSVPAHNYAIYSISFSPDYSFFATGSRDKTIKIWDAKDQSFITRIDKEKNEGHTHSVNKVLWVNDMIISAGDDRKIIGWKIKV